ncbi:MAG: TVP38/TMEM64 family protein, partial [Lactococcus lactis]|nr:TVP38/TMEM64 family protein [Lactococcus lactis]
MNDNVLRYVKRVFNVITILGFVATIVGGVYLWR